MKSIKKLFGEAAVYGTSSILGRAVNFLLVPLYTSVFDPALFGIVTELYAYVAFFMVVFLYGVETTFFRFATHSKDEAFYFRLATTQSLVFAVGFSTLIIFFSGHIADFLNYPHASQYIVCLALVLGLDTLVAVPFASLRLQGKAKIFASFKVLNIVINVTCNLCFLVLLPYLKEKYDSNLIDYFLFLNNPVGYVFVSNLLASLGTFLFFIPQWVSFRPLMAIIQWKKMLLYATPLVIIGFSSVANEMLSRVMLKHYLPVGYYPYLTNLAVLGIFGACYKLSMLMNLAVQAFRYAYEPFYFSQSDQKNSPILFANVMHTFILFGSLAFIMISVALPELAPILLKKPSYLQALHIVPLLLLASLFLGIFQNLSLWYKITDNVKYGALISLSGSLITILFNIALIPHFGYEGAAVTTLLTYSLMAISSYLLGQKKYPIPYKTKQGVFFIVYAVLVLSVIYYFDFPIFQRYIAGLGAIFLLLIIVYSEKMLKKR